MIRRGKRVNKKQSFFGDFGINDAAALNCADKTCNIDILEIVTEMFMLRR